MILLSLFSILIHIASLWACIQYFREDGSSRTEERAIVGGIGFSCATFLGIHSLLLLSRLQGADPHPDPLESIVTGFLTFNGVIYFVVIHAFARYREGRTNHHATENHHETAF